MVFASLYFVCFFFIIWLIVYSNMATIRGKNIVLLVFSMIFYAWGGAQYLVLLVGMTFAAWFCAKEIERRRDTALCTAFFISGCVILIGLLCIFKYTGFILESIQFVAGVPEKIPEIVLPIGISFYTFQLLSYVA